MIEIRSTVAAGMGSVGRGDVFGFGIILGLSVQVVVGITYNPAMVTRKIDNDDENVHENYFRTHRMWKAGRGKNWFYPAADGAHVRLFWDKQGKPCLEYVDGSSETISMVRSGHKLEHYAYAMEQLEEKLGADFNTKVVNQVFVTMRNWPVSERSKPV